MTATTQAPFPPVPKLQCLHASRCGGCPLISLPVEEQRKQKLDGLRSLFERHDLQPQCDFHFHPKAAKGGYRNRIRLKISDLGKIEFFNQEKSEDCAVLAPPLLKSLALLLQQQEHVTDALLDCSYLELRTPDLDNLSSVFFARKAGKTITSADKKMLRDVLQAHAFVVAFDDQSTPTSRFPLTKTVYQRVPIGSFMQVNFEVNEALIENIVNLALRHKVQAVLDVYCGSGNFLLPLLKAGLRGTGIESDPAAIEALTTAAAEQDFEGTFICADALAWATTQTNLPSFDLLVLDPPRAGLKDALEPLARLNAPFIALCSCNSISLARDLSELHKLGYELSSCTLFDMFEHTSHIEVLSWLEKRGSADVQNTQGTSLPS